MILAVRLQKDRTSIGFYIIIAALFVLNLWSLMRYPAPYPDEATLTSRAWNYISTGRAFGTLDEGIAEAYDHYWIAFQWLITFLHSLVLRFFPAPSLLALRAFSLFLGILLLAVTYLLARRLGGKEVAYISVLLLASSRAFLHSAHQVRYDIFATLLAYTSLALVVLDTRGRFWVGLIAGLVTGLAVETHLNSLIFLPAIGVVYFLTFGWFCIRKGSFWGFVLGCSVGVVYYLGLHYFPNPDTSRLITQLAFGYTERPPILSFDPGVILGGMADVLKLLLVSSGPMILLAVLAVFRLLSVRSREGYTIIAFNASLIITAGLIMPHKVGHYAIYLAPAFVILIGTYLVKFFSLPWNGRIEDYLKRVLVWGVTAGGIALGIMVIIPNQYSAYQQAQADINSVVTAEDTVMGTQTYWLGLHDRTYRSWELLFLYQRLSPKATLEDAFLKFRPTILIIDPELRNLIADDVDPNSRWYYYHLPKMELDEFLSRHAKLVMNRENSPGSLFQVYRIEQGE